MRTPTSRSSFQVRLNLFDVAWAALSPGIALWLRDASIFDSGADQVPLYWALSFGLALLAFIVFRIRDGFTPHFSVYDALGVAKAVVLTELLTTLALFATIRLEGIPRSTPIIHGLILAFGLVAARTIFRLFQHDRPALQRLAPAVQEHVIFIGATRLTALFIQILQVCSAKKTEVLGVLDSNPGSANQTISNVRVIGSPHQLQALVEEFAEHGIKVNRVLVGGDASLLPLEAASELKDLCDRREIELVYIPALIGIGTADGAAAIAESTSQEFDVPFYFAIKRFVEPVIALLLLLILSPLLVIIALLVLIDVGSPLLYWQHRVGRDRQPFLIHKFRTLRPMFDETGTPVATAERASLFGEFLRRTRLDELPQLLNVVVGDMSLIGPRPLLPHDQPDGADLRLMVKPGITGWAQVNGGEHLSPAEKNALDEDYVRRASFWLDMKISLLTVAVLFHRRVEG